MNFSNLVNSKFKGCSNVCGVRIKLSNAEGIIKIFNLPGANGEHFGALYPDGASMIWPKSWLDNKAKKNILSPSRALLLRPVNG